MHPQYYRPRLLYSIKASRLCIQISQGKRLFEISSLKSRELLSLTVNDFNYRWYCAFLSSTKRECFSLSFSTRWESFWNRCRDVEPLSHVSVGLLSCNNLISQRHASTGLWRHLMSVALFSSVSNFMTSPLFYSMARSGLWTCNDNWEEKQCCAQLCTKSFCQQLKLWVSAYDCEHRTADKNNYHFLWLCLAVKIFFFIWVLFS